MPTRYLLSHPTLQIFRTSTGSVYYIEDGRIANMHGVTRYTTVATISEECHAVCHYSFTAFTWSLLDGTAHRGSSVILYNLAELITKNKNK